MIFYMSVIKLCQGVKINSFNLSFSQTNSFVFVAYSRDAQSCKSKCRLFSQKEWMCFEASCMLCGSGTLLSFACYIIQLNMQKCFVIANCDINCVPVFFHIISHTFNSLSRYPNHTENNAIIVVLRQWSK